MLNFYFRDVSGVELLMNLHQAIKLEIDARDESFADCISLGKELIAKGHYALKEVRNSELYFRASHCHLFISCCIFWIGSSMFWYGLNNVDKFCCCYVLYLD